MLLLPAAAAVPRSPTIYTDQYTKYTTYYQSFPKTFVDDDVKWQGELLLTIEEEI